MKERLPGLPAVLLTDTAFRRDLPDVARHYSWLDTPHVVAAVEKETIIKLRAPGFICGIQ